MLGTQAGGGGAPRLSQEEQCEGAALPASPPSDPPSFEAPSSLLALPPAVQVS